jgi:hypothetical protein
MDHDHDFSSLRNLLALRRLDVPMDTEVNRFLIEFHRRQRAQLLVRETLWSRLQAWMGGKIPSLSYASGLACLAILAILPLSNRTPATGGVGRYQLSLNAPSTSAAPALVSTAYVRDASAASNDLTFRPSARGDATRFVLASTRVAYDATAAF